MEYSNMAVESMRAKRTFSTGIATFLPGSAPSPLRRARFFAAGSRAGATWRLRRWMSCGTSRTYAGAACLRLAVLAVSLLGMTACSSQQLPTRRNQTDVTPGWPKGHEPWRETSTVVVPAGWNDAQEPQHPAIRVPLPVIPGAEAVGQDAFCASCHETYAQAFAEESHSHYVEYDTIVSHKLIFPSNFSFFLLSFVTFNLFSTYKLVHDKTF